MRKCRHNRFFLTKKGGLAPVSAGRHGHLDTWFHTCDRILSIRGVQLLTEEPRKKQIPATDNRR